MGPSSGGLTLLPLLFKSGYPVLRIHEGLGLIYTVKNQGEEIPLKDFFSSPLNNCKHSYPPNLLRFWIREF